MVLVRRERPYVQTAMNAAKERNIPAFVRMESTYVSASNDRSNSCPKPWLESLDAQTTLAYTCTSCVHATNECMSHGEHVFAPGNPGRPLVPAARRTLPSPGTSTPDAQFLLRSVPSTMVRFSRKLDRS